MNSSCIDVERHGLTHYSYFTQDVIDKEGNIKLTADAAGAALLIKDLATDYYTGGWISKQRAEEFRDRAEELARAIEAKDKSKAEKLTREVELDAQKLVTQAVVTCQKIYDLSYDDLKRLSAQKGLPSGTKLEMARRLSEQE